MKTMSRFATGLGAAFALSIFLSAGASAAGTTIFTVLPATPGVSTATITPVLMDSAPGFSFGSFANNGGATKSEIYLLPEVLFPGRASPVTIGDISSISYWTKNSYAQTGSQVDWALVLYTKPYPGDLSSPTWYGDRYGAEPYFSNSLDAPANTWNQWSSDVGANQLRFYESTQGAPGSGFGSYTDPYWGAFKAAVPLSSVGTRMTQEILYVSIQTGSLWTTGFTGKLDGLRIELTDGSVAKVNFEPFLVAADMDSCKKDGWKTLFRADGTGFNNQGDCIQYVNTGK